MSRVDITTFSFAPVASTPSSINISEMQKVSLALAGSSPEDLYREESMESMEPFDLCQTDVDQQIPVHIYGNHGATTMKIHDSALRRSGVWRRYLDIPNHPICPDYSNMYIRVDASDFPFIPRDELVVYMRKTLNFLYTDEIIWGGLGPNSGEMCLGFARLYLMGSKLDIPELMKEALKELSGMTVQLGPCEILHIAEFLYPNEEDVHSEFRIWFGKNGGCVVKSDDDAIKDRMKEAIFRGGYLARDLWTLKEKSQTEYRKDLGKDLAKVMASAQVLNNVLAKKD